tara:strand:- start:288 stop:1271 length:984 start_codon:yes stop_codon:yes gene_type:complete
MIATDDLAKLKAAVDLRTLFEARGVRFNSRGRARCPFHDERSPSFHLWKGRRYKCFGCGAGGDALDALQELGGLTFPKAVDELKRLAGRSLEDLPPAPVLEARPEVRAPKEEVGELWASCLALTRSARDYLGWRGLDPDRVAALDLCRVLPTSPLPAWARFGRMSWGEAGYPLVFPLFDEQGELASLRARPCESRQPKALPAQGLSSRGLLLANAEGALLLRGKVFSHALVAEGETDLIAASLRWSGLPVVAVYSGGWRSSLAGAFPEGAHVLVGTHHDKAGDRYAATIARDLSGRCRLTRLGRSQWDLAERYQRNDLPGDPWGGAQ